MGDERGVKTWYAKGLELRVKYLMLQQIIFMANTFYSSKVNSIIVLKCLYCISPRRENEKEKGDNILINTFIAWKKKSLY